MPFLCSKSIGLSRLVTPNDVRNLGILYEEWTIVSGKSEGDSSFLFHIFLDQLIYAVKISTYDLANSFIYVLEIKSIDILNISDYNELEKLTATQFSSKRKGYIIMRKIVLLCSAGMSTSLLVTNMKKAAAEIGYQTDISAHPLSQADTYGSDADMILLAPQMRFELPRIQAKFADKKIEEIEMRAYGTMNGKAVIEQVKKALGD